MSAKSCRELVELIAGFPHYRERGSKENWDAILAIENLINEARTPVASPPPTVTIAIHRDSTHPDSSGVIQKPVGVRVIIRQYLPSEVAQEAIADSPKFQWLPLG